jgi:hypothetical protein
MKVCPMVTELLHADRRTNTTKLIEVCRNFANVSKNRKVGIMTRLRFRRSGFQISTGIKDYSHLHTVQTCSGAHPIQQWVLSQG